MSKTTRVFVPAIADNNLLSNFVDADASGLLFKLLGGAVYVAPSVIDPTERIPHTTAPLSETHRFIYERTLELGRLEADPLFDAIRPSERYQTQKQRVALRTGFVNAQDILWKAAKLEAEAVSLAFQLREQYRVLKNRLADAECLALAKLNGWQLLTDDSGMVEVATAFQVKTERSCGLLLQAIQAKLATCSKVTQALPKNLTFSCFCPKSRDSA